MYKIFGNKAFFLMIILFNLLNINKLNAQTVQIATPYSCPQAQVFVPVKFIHCYNLGEIFFSIQYSPANLEFVGIDNLLPQFVNVNVETSGNIVEISWQNNNENGLDVPSGKFLDLEFNYITGSSAIVFNEESTMHDNDDILLIVNYMDGGVDSYLTTFPPLVRNINNQSVQRGAAFVPINLNNHVQDDNTPDSEIVWEVEPSEFFSVEIDSFQFAQVIAKDTTWLGADTLIFRAFDDCRLSGKDSVVFTVINEHRDLTVSNVWLASNEVVRGEYLPTKVYVNNIGRLPVEDMFYLYYRLSLDTIYEPFDFFLAHRIVFPIEANDSSFQIIEPLQIPMLPANEYYLIINADEFNEIDEGNEWNNTTVRKITVTNPESVDYESFTSTQLIPNPNNGNFSIFTGSVSYNFSFKIYNFQGKLLKHDCSESNETIRLDNFSSGIYFIVIEPFHEKYSSFAFKFVVE